ncbi:SMI1/KNR4 family protein [Actinomadura logoneensis]|uniref:SMI1/KNR4 family protein n=1 Tax=Actinomadura logoneensis TaxID=2293572 RepID=A0A372J957_9ACTN|nr:SMI1/KNR4 family protein [Actinomadura logoneensis]RFU36523.1 SMI1/KNR4 family protein [Actinomadura logoneensis]
MSEDIRTRIEHIRARLDRLRELDPPRPGASRFVDDDGNRLDGHIVFGADLHRYENQPVPDDVLTDLETAMGCELPEEFRAFLSAVGCGAGPYYGLDWRSMKGSAGPACAVPFPEGDAGPLYLDEDEEDALEDGHLLTTHLGCGDFLGVVTAGPSRGRVVTIDHSNAEWRLGPPFLDHYLAWIERAVSRLDSPTRPDRIL